jgi:hypothetical protein
MAKSGQYTRARRIVMQGVMFCVLGGTVALAALVSRRQVAEFEVRLTQAVEVGRLRVWLPEDWEIEGPAAPAPGRFDVSASEPGPELTRRSIAVVQFPSSEKLQAEMQKLAPPRARPTRRNSRFERFHFLGQEGLRDEVVAEIVPPDGGEPRRFGKTYALTVMPGGWAVLVKVEGEMAFGPATRRVLEQVARKLELLPAPAATPAPTSAPAVVR